MRRFSSYGPVNDRIHYYAPRTELIERGYTQLIGETPDEGGHYFTVWAPRQTGKTWTMQELVQRIQKAGDYHAAIFSMQPAKKKKTEEEVLKVLLNKMRENFEIPFPDIHKINEIASLFTKQYFQKPVILIIDEFDALGEDFINGFADIFRDMFITRNSQSTKKSAEKTNLLHGLALIGVRSVLGIENVQGSPFNTQRNLQIPNLTLEEVRGIFQWYEQESGQTLEPAVIERLFIETNGQPGLTCWFGELLTEGCTWFTNDTTKPITMDNWNYTYMYATQALPNNNILNVISKVKVEPYKSKALELFRTDEKVEFQFDNKDLNYLYMNGAIDLEENRETLKLYVKFANPFLQKRLFNYFSNDIFPNMGRLLPPLENMDDTITESFLHIHHLIEKYQRYLGENKTWLFSDAPRRKDMRIFEAVFHFNLYRFLYDLLKEWKSSVTPEFPTGNGKIDLLIRHGQKLYGVELKTFTTEKGYKDALIQTARYGQQLGLAEISVIFFIDVIDEQNKQRFESDFQHTHGTGTITVKPIFVQTGQ